MSTSTTIIIPFDCQRTSQNSFSHHGSRFSQSSANKQAHRAARAAWLAAGQPRWTCKVRLDIIVRRARAMDEVNIPGACKALIDGIFRERNHRGEWIDGALPDDSAKWLKLGSYGQEIDKKYRHNEFVVFTITPVDESHQENMEWPRKTTERAGTTKAMQSSRARSVGSARAAKAPSPSE